MIDIFRFRLPFDELEDFGEFDDLVGFIFEAFDESAGFDAFDGFDEFDGLDGLDGSEGFG